jgi:cysteine-rich repeat protein
MNTRSLFAPGSSFLLCFVALAACNEQRVPGVDSLPDAVILDDTGDIGSDVNLNPDALDDAVDLDVAVDSNEDAADVDPDVVIPPNCGDGALDEGEECDNGDNNGAEPDACRIDCTLARCGDGVVDSSEACDPGDEPNGECRADCNIPECGDGVLDEGEQCDDGNVIDTDGCSNACEEVLAALCQPCEADDDCGRDGDFCLGAADGSYCGIDCAVGCPDGFECRGVETGDGEAVEQCVPTSGTCSPCLDADNDSFGIGPECAGFDCNDANDTVYPGAAEVCDDVDNNCDGQIDNDTVDGILYFADADNDGFGNDRRSVRTCSAIPPNELFTATVGGDCSDADALVFPGAFEGCDGLDNDCDATTTDGDADDDVGVACDGPDSDSCLSGTSVCDDGAVACVEAAGSTAELCDGIDNDCNPATADGAAEATLGESCDGPDADACESGSVICRAGGLVCDGDVASGPEVCDGRDNNCDGAIDNDATDASTWFFDNDGDGYGAAASALVACAAPTGYVAQGGDCDDDSDDVYPDNVELCDGVDNNCDGLVDNDPLDGEFYYVDEDGDGYGSDAEVVIACDQPDGTALLDGDCDDSSDAVNPGRTEVCGDGGDNNCDGAADCGDDACADLDACADDSCTSVDLGSNLGRVAAGSNLTTNNNAQGSCGGAGGDVLFAWRAPAAGRYRFDTSGSNYDTVLYAARGGCSGTEVACNDNIVGGSTSRIFVDVAANELLILVLDGSDFFRSRGNYVLNIAAAEICGDGADNDGDTAADCFDADCSQSDACLADCATRNIGSALGASAATGTTVGAGFRVQGTCGGDGRDATLLWTAPRAASYTFTATGTGFAPLLHIRRGSCTGAELACATGGDGGASITQTLAAGQALAIAIDGNGAAAGAWNLAIRAQETGFCSDTLDNDGDTSIDCADLDCDLDTFCCPADRWEPNQGVTGSISTLYTAYLADPDATLTLRPGDIDSFNLPVCEGAEIDARARFTNAGGNIDLVLRNQNGQVVDSSQSTTTDGERIEYVVNTLPPGNRLFLQAYMPTGVTTCNDYVLEIQVNGCD